MWEVRLEDEGALVPDLYAPAPEDRAMKLLFGDEYRLWQTMRAEHARLVAELEGAERMNQTFTGTIRQLMEDLKYMREQNARLMDNFMQDRGLPPVSPEAHADENPFEEDATEVDAIRKRIENWDAESAA